ncbi:MAG: aminomethyl transferase family protein [Elusimicrobia bacterium]|nr:aminomethyl transferase family protein [Elusimicrobiota bacterium]
MSVAIADLSHLGKVVFKGPDSQKFLNGLLTNDIKNLQPNQGLPTCLLTPQGKLVAYFWLYRRKEDFIVLHPLQTTAVLLDALSQYTPLSQTVMEDVGETLGAFYSMGPQAGAFLEKLLDLSLPKEGVWCSEVHWNEVQLYVLSYPAYASDGLLLLFPASLSDQLLERVAETGKPYDVQMAGPEMLEVLRVESGIPMVGVDTDADTFPLEVNLESAVSFTKGCYLGQEIIARIKNMGHVNRKLVGLKMDEKPTPGSVVLLEGQPVGKITSVVESSGLKAFLALATVRLECSQPGTVLGVAFEDGKRMAEVVSLPLL